MTARPGRTTNFIPRCGAFAVDFAHRPLTSGKPAPAIAAPRPAPQVSTPAPARLAWLLGSLLLFAIVALVVMWVRLRASSPYDEFVRQCRPGPWGELQYTRMLIEPPETLVTDEVLAPHPARWFFAGYSRETLHPLCEDAGLAPDALDAFIDPASPGGAVIVRPPAEFVLGLSASARAALYGVLALSPENPNQQEPFRFRAADVDEWFADSGLAPATIAAVRRVLYRRGTSVICSDADVLLPTLPTREERTRLLLTLARKSTLLVKLRVRPDSDIAALEDYWGRGPRAKDIGSLLQSLAKRPRGITIDITHLLTRFARARIYTYPGGSDRIDASHDCHWSSLNFFNDPPDDTYADAEVVRKAFENDYEPVEGPRTFGDVLLFARGDDEVIHSCIYIADDIVFTKNGASSTIPWMLMSLDDVIAFYPADKPLTVRTYRRKNL